MEIAKHYGHKVVVARYSDLENVFVNYSVECEDCFEVIVDEEVN
jgi:hypothetical protein